jgi:hypothetical protein
MHQNHELEMGSSCELLELLPMNVFWGHVVGPIDIGVAN